MFRQAARPWLAAAARTKRRPCDALPSAQAVRNYTQPASAHGLRRASASKSRSRNSSAVRNYARSSRTTAFEDFPDFENLERELDALAEAQALPSLEDGVGSLEDGAEAVQEHESNEEHSEAREEGEEGLEEYEEDADSSEESKQASENVASDVAAQVREYERLAGPDKVAAWREIQSNRTSYKTLRAYRS